MSEQIAQTSHNAQNDGRRIRKSPDVQVMNTVPGVISRERSFIRTSSQQNANKRRSLAFNQQPNHQQPQLRTGGKPAIEIYRPPNVRIDGNSLNKLNVHAQEFTMYRQSPGDLPSPRSSIIFPSPGNHLQLQQSKSSASIHQQMQNLAAVAAVNRHHHGGGIQMSNMNHNPQHHHQRAIYVQHPMQLNQMGGIGMGMQSSQLPLVNSPSSGNILHQANAHRVKFAADPQIQTIQNQMNNNNNFVHNNNPNKLNVAVNPLQRSKSLSSADAIARGMAGLGLGLGNEATDIGQFPPEIQALIDKAIEDPNQLNARSLMELSTAVMRRAIEARGYALPASRLCISIIAKEQNETFLESLLNTCRQWYQEREKILYSIQGMKSPSRTRFTAFMAFLTEMFCQLKRRQLQLRTQCDGVPPPLVLLTLLSKCCEDCVRPPVRSLSEIECLFFVLTCIGRDLETQLPQQLDSLLASVRDAFLNSSASAPAIRRTLLQLIELHASHWQLPGNTVLYYYPSTK